MECLFALTLVRCVLFEMCGRPTNVGVVWVGWGVSRITFQTAWAYTNLVVKHGWSCCVLDLLFIPKKECAHTSVAVVLESWPPSWLISYQHAHRGTLEVWATSVVTTERKADITFVTHLYSTVCSNVARYFMTRGYQVLAQFLGDLGGFMCDPISRDGHGATAKLETLWGGNAID